MEDWVRNGEFVSRVRRDCFVCIPPQSSFWSPLPRSGGGSGRGRFSFLYFVFNSTCGAIPFCHASASGAIGGYSMSLRCSRFSALDTSKR